MRVVCRNIKRVWSLTILIFLFSACVQEEIENGVKNQLNDPFEDYLVLGENSKKVSEFPLPWKSDSYFVDITYPELKSSYDTIKKPNFCKHYIIVETSCGTSCQQGFMIDVRNGEQYELPRPKMEEWEGNGNINIEYNAQYNLLIEHQELSKDGVLLACSASWKWDEQQKRFNLIYPVVLPTLKGLNDKNLIK